MATVSLNIDENALSTARTYAADQGITLDQAVASLIEIGARPKTEVKQMENGLFVFVPPDGTPILTSEKISELLNEF